MRKKRVPLPDYSPSMMRREGSCSLSPMADSHRRKGAETPIVEGLTIRLASQDPSFQSPSHLR